ncbi:malate dehydrogenase [Culex quinquefasciatus]|uniref:Malate dehydrogenase n=1 Tax=Culex quinquefasciatus TaxID=7176 RepID=B0XGI1_CULQU|nr:malate dehydrogenase [Culex quinquefasciatus]|eukprot:XP_001868753.1 malate dehydrogenase [Culex quinquefasciatus]
MEKWDDSKFKFRSIPNSIIRDQWVKYKRNFQYIAEANEEKNATRLKNVFLAKAGPDVQEVFASLPGADVEEDKAKNIDPFKVAIEKLDEYFSPKQHEAFERNTFWNLKPQDEETMEKFLWRTLEVAQKCNFGTTLEESRSIAVIDKVILYAPVELKQQLLQKEKLTLDDVTRVNVVPAKRPGGSMNHWDNKKPKYNPRQVEDNASDPDENKSFVYNISDGDEFIWVKVGGVLMQMLIDSGSAKNILDDRAWEHLRVQGAVTTNFRTDYRPRPHRRMIGIISNPVNSVFPIACDTLLKVGVLDTRCMFGISTLEIIRANTLIGPVPEPNLLSPWPKEQSREEPWSVKVNDYEQELLKKAIPKLMKNIQKVEELDMNKIGSSLRRSQSAVQQYLFGERAGFTSDHSGDTIIPVHPRASPG